MVNLHQRLVNGLVGHNEAGAAASPFHRMRSLERQRSVCLIGGWLRGFHSKEQATNYFVLKECKAAGPPALSQCMSVSEINHFNCSDSPSHHFAK